MQRATNYSDMYIEKGRGEVLLLLHGILGAVHNWTSVLNHFVDRYKIVIPKLPIHTVPIQEASLQGLVTFLEGFIEHKQLKNITLIGNSLGGHLALIYTLRNPHQVNKLVLTGSSGLFENTMGDSFPKRGNYEYVKKMVEYTFFDPNTVTKEFVDEIFGITNNIFKAIRILKIAKSARKTNMADLLTHLNTPTLLIWGLNDTITPPKVAHEFNRFIRQSKLRFLDECCHAPMMEQPAKFNRMLEDFLQAPTDVSR